MPEPETPLRTAHSRRLLLDFLLVLLVLGCLAVLQPFLAAIAWAVILSYVTWPVHRRIHAALGKFDPTAALLSTTLVICAVVVPVLWLAVMVQGELMAGYRSLAAYFVSGPHPLPAAVRNIPGIGAQMQASLDRLAVSPEAFGSSLMGWVQRWVTTSPGLAANIGRNVGKALTTVFTLYFCYRDGDSAMRQARAVIRRHFGKRLDPYFQSAGTMTRTVVYGSLICALAQGLIAGLGFWIVGMQAPVLLGALTGLLSAVPWVGTASVWGPIAAWLLVTGKIWQGVVLLGWGVLLVHPTDNILRPFLISRVAHVPFLLVMFGALGGLSCFGLVGVFIGPVLLTVGLAIWRAWAEV